MEEHAVVGCRERERERDIDVAQTARRSLEETSRLLLLLSLPCRALGKRVTVHTKRLLEVVIGQKVLTTIGIDIVRKKVLVHRKLLDGVWTTTSLNLLGDLGLLDWRNEANASLTLGKNASCCLTANVGINVIDTLTKSQAAS
jgi:hypothetical protein